MITTVWAYVNTSKQVGAPEQIKVFATTDAAETWFAENDPEGAAFEYEVLECIVSAAGSPLPRTAPGTRKGPH